MLVEHLARLREEAGVTQAALALRMGTDQAAVAKLESHRHDPRLSTVLRYVAALGEPGSQLLGLLEGVADDRSEEGSEHSTDGHIHLHEKKPRTRPGMIPTIARSRRR
ncbi:helix-turn-helix domain-containing protein [Ornithinimicrobium sp. CNJ-824]|uniref:helix-turn-helix domain-containing protein n=1 Tax=Ornithinimicrobium sp. CNJ-824 TaxID=1904966 RepID=UPI00192D0F93